MPVSSGPNSIASDTELLRQLGLERRRKVVLVVDMVESVSLMAQDELGVIHQWQAFLAHVDRSVLPAHGGRLVKSLGDGLMIEFAEARQAVDAASGMHAWAADAAPVRSGRRLGFRIGLHSASFLADARDIYGSDVNLAARVAALATPGQTLVTPQVQEQLVEGMDGELTDCGERYVKHVAEPIRVYEVRSAPQAAAAAVADREIEKPVVVVLPFDARGVDAEQALVGDLIADAVIHQLARTELLVLSRLTSASIHGRGLSPAQIREQVGARYALSGTCHATGGRLLVSAELVDLTDDGTVLWSARHAGTLDDLLTPDSELAGQISEGAFTAIAEGRGRHAASQPPSSLGDYSLLLGGIALMHRQSRTDFRRAHELLEHLTERRPRFGAPRAWLGQWYAIGAAQGWLTDVAVEARRAMAQVDRAIQDDPSLSLAMTIKGQVASYMQKNFDEAERAYRQALAENPNEGLAWLFTAALHAWRGEGAQARDAADRALLLSPIHPARYFYESLAATAYLAAGELAQARRLAEHSIRTHCLHTSTHKTLVVVSVLQGDIRRAREVAGQLLALEPGFTVNGFLARSPMARSPLASEIARSMREAGIAAG